MTTTEIYTALANLSQTTRENFVHTNSKLSKNHASMTSFFKKEFSETREQYKKTNQLVFALFAVVFVLILVNFFTFLFLRKQSESLMKLRRSFDTVINKVIQTFYNEKKMTFPDV